MSVLRKMMEKLGLAKPKKPNVILPSPVSTASLPSTRHRPLAQGQSTTIGHPRLSAAVDRRPPNRHHDNDDVDVEGLVDAGFDIVDAFRRNRSRGSSDAPLAVDIPITPTPVTPHFASKGGGDFGGGGADERWGCKANTPKSEGGGGWFSGGDGDTGSSSDGGGCDGGDMRLIATLHENASGRRTKSHRILEMA